MSPPDPSGYNEVFGLDRFELHRSAYLPDRTCLVVS